MAIMTNNNPTLLDLAKATDPNGSIADVAELLTETNEILMDATFVEGNLPTGHRTTIRTGLPKPTWRKLYGGVQPTKGKTAQVDEATGMLEAYAEVDKALADLASNTAAFRMLEERAHIEGLNQEMANTLFYGDESVNPERFTGLSARYNKLSADNGENIISAGGTGGDNSSIWLILWSPMTVHGIIPKGSTAGLQRQDMGEVTIENVDGSNGRMQAYRSHYRWDAGISVRDWRYVVRIPNIDKSLLTRDGKSGANLPDLMHDAMNMIPNLSMGRAAWYCSRNTLSFIRKQVANSTSGSTLEMKDVGGTMQTEFAGIPIRRCDALSADEARVT